MFKEEFGIGARVYNGKRLAEDSAALASFRKGGAAETGDLEIRNSMEVGAAEKQFKDAFGITVKIEDSTGKLADKSVTIASLKPEKAENDVKEAGRGTGKASSRKASSPKIKKGGYVEFGSYYQENSAEKTPIVWLVLETSGSRALLISRSGLDSRPYHYEYTDITWENCDLRKWLNGDFLMTAFTAEERERIALTMLPNDDNPLNGTFGGYSTEDRVFCLSLAEARSRFKVKNPDKNSLGDDSFLFKDRESRKCIPTLYAAEKRYRNHSYDLLDGKRCCYWWLRSPGIKACRASSVCADGCYVFDHLITVRPALWVNL